MQSSNEPVKISVPFAQNGDKQVIPVASQVGVADGRASYNDGFPPITRIDILAGGVPPFGTDFNGILYAITNMLRWQNSGGVPKFDSAFSASIGGYPKGAVLQKATGIGWWISTVENNTSNPDGASPAGWVDAFARVLSGLGTMSAQNANSVAITGGSISGITDLAISDGGTGASTKEQALANLGGAPLASPALTGTPTAPTAAVGNSTAQVATTAFVSAEITNDRPFEATASNIKMNGTQAVGSLNTVARGDHVHPTDTTRAPLASPALTGTPTAPTAGDGTNTTQLATTAFVQGAVGGYLSKSGLTGGTVTLTDAESSNPVITFLGTLTSNLVVVVPGTIKRLWSVFNATSGAFTLTVKTASGSGVAVAQGRRNLVYTDGTNVYDGFNDFESIAMTGAPTAPTAAVGTNTAQLATTAFTKAQIAADVPTTIAGQAVGEVGTYGFFMLYGGTTGVNIAPGTTIAGSNLRYAAAGWGGTTAPTGTWRVMGAAADADGSDTNSITLCMRIS